MTKTALTARISRQVELVRFEPDTHHLLVVLRFCLHRDLDAAGGIDSASMVFQVTIDDVPMQGHTVTFPQPQTPVVIETEETDQNLPRMVAHHFFDRVPAGPHKVAVNVAAGSNIVAPFIPTVEAPVLSIHYR